MWGIFRNEGDGRQIMESNRIEYKRELTDTLEKEVVAFLNYREGGVIYIGIDDNGKSVTSVPHCDAVQLKIKDRLKTNILPSCLGLFDVIHEKREGKDIIKITLASGPEKPYYLKKYGMSEKGCYVRIGSSAEPMSARMIEELFSKRTRNTIGFMHSPRSDLSFEQLKIYYQAAGFKLNDNFLSNLELLTPDKQLNYAAYLLADNNGVSVKVAKYADTTRVYLTENKEYGYCSLVKACKQILDKMEVENITFTKITSRERLERKMIDRTALREAIINAIIHNDYSNGATPKVEFFSDRLEITSAGGLPFGFNRNDFFSGLSVPRNKELMRVFRDLELVEQLGSGIPRILQKYDPSVFQFSENFLRVTFEYKKPFSQDVGVESGVESNMDFKVIFLLETQSLGKKEIAFNLGKDKPYRYLNEVIARLVRDEMLEMTIPEKPNSRLQKYRLTDKSRKWILRLRKER